MSSDSSRRLSHDLLPTPERLTWATGELPIDARLIASVVGSTDPRIEAALARTKRRLEREAGAGPASGDTTRGARLEIECPGDGERVQAVGEDESYRLTVAPEGARLVASNPLGILRGLATIDQLVRRADGRVVLPAVAIADRPRFPWRGLLVDPCRRWQPLEVIKRNLEGLAAVKLNVLHWHLTDDQGFRVESRRFPKLHEAGSDGLYYRQDEVREVIAYARDGGIRVVPEFDLPGHATAWLVGHPELGCLPGSFELIREWGIFDNLLDPTRDEVYAFLDAFFGEMAGLFPDAYVHIGGDEVSPRQWNESPAILDFMYRHRLRGPQDLQAHFNRRLSGILAGHGKKMVGWDEILHPDLPKDLVIQSWQGTEALAQSARMGYRGILSNGYYLDNMYDAAFHHRVDPIPADSTLDPEERARILGGEACMWGEFVSPETIDSRIWPRTAAVAERLWSAAEGRDVEDMYRRLEVQSRRLEAFGLTHRSGYEPMLERLAGAAAVAPLKVLADVVTPVKLYTRGRMRRYTSATPLDRLVDAARPESDTARRFRADLDRLLGAPPASLDDGPVRAALVAWRENHAALGPLLDGSRAAEARTLSQDLAELGALGLEALEHLSTGQPPPRAWREDAARRLEGAAVPRAEVELAVVPAVRKLVMAAEEVEARASLSPAEWSVRLDAQLEAARPAAPAHG